MAYNNVLKTGDDDDLNIKDVILKVKQWIIYFQSKWVFLLLMSLLGIIVGYVYGTTKDDKYVSTLTFALEDEKAASGLSDAMGLASSLGFDLGTTAGGAFSGGNLMELMKSRTLVEKALLNPISVTGKNISIADYYIKLTNLNKDWEKDDFLKKISFPPFADRTVFTQKHDSILGVLYSQIAGPNGILSVNQKDKKISIISVEVKATDEILAKAFTESVVKEVSEFYIETRSKKAKNNVNILQHQVDSIRSELNAAISGVANLDDFTFNLNPAQNAKRSPSLKRQIDVQANTAILTQLVTNLEMAKVTLLKETPLVQIIDRPILPLTKEKANMLFLSIGGGFLGIAIGFFIVFIRKITSDLLN